MKALEGRNQSQVMSVKTDLQWPTLGDERSDSKDVSEFYDHFEDNCGLANSCKGMNYREMLLALRSRCRGSRLKTFTNLYKSAYRAGEIEKDPEKVYKRIKAKHLMFSESPEEREIRVDAEHVALAKGKMTGHQFEPLFEASVTERETVGLGKSKRELYLSYLRKMPAHLQKEIRSDKRLWAGETQLRGPQTWEEAHRVVLEVEQREATHRATANAVYSTETERQQQPPKKEPKKPQEPKAPKQQLLVRGETSATTPTTRSFGKRRWRRRSSTRRADQFSRLRAKEGARGTRKGKVREPEKEKEILKGRAVPRASMMERVRRKSSALSSGRTAPARRGPGAICCTRS